MHSGFQLLPTYIAIMKTSSKWIVACAWAAIALVSQGCSTISSHPTDQGTSDHVVFPKADTAWPKEGTYPNIDNLRLLGPGMTKDQLYALLGRPHFKEGMFGVREWDYLFNFRTGKPAPDDVAQCQMKVLFDKDMLTRSYFWAPESCAALMKPVAAAPKAPQAQTTTLGADALFAFDGASAADILPQGRQQVETLGHQLAGMKSVARVDVVAYTDPLGPTAYNQRLSQQRAETVRQMLIAQGLPAQSVTATGRGAADPVAKCPDLPRAALIQCLAPDRRVEIRVGTAQ